MKPIYFKMMAGLALGLAVWGAGNVLAHPARAATLSPLAPLAQPEPHVNSSQTLTVSVNDQAATKAASPALNFVKSTAERGLTFLSDPNSTQDQKKSEFKKLLDASFDLDTIGRFVLGKYWNSATPAQQQEYSRYFKQMVVNVYAGRFGEYKGQKFEVKSVQTVNATDSLVTSFIYPVNGGDPVQVDWRVRQKGGTFKIVDVLVAGVSMSITQRSDFASVIQRGGGDLNVLIDYLKQKSVN